MVKISRVVSIVSLYVSCVYGASPDSTEAFKLYCTSKYVEADREYRKIYQHALRDPDEYQPQSQAELHDLMNLGGCKWAQGDICNAFRLLQMRNRGIGDRDNRVATGASTERKPLLKELPYGVIDTDVRGKKILFRGEHGLGDSVTFINGVKPFIDAGSQLIIVIQNPLKAVWTEQLLKYAKNITIYSQNDEKNDEQKRSRGEAHNPDFTEYDHDCYLMSLPLYTSKVGLFPTYESAQIPQWRLLTVPEQRVTKWFDFFKKEGVRPLLICSYASSNPVPGGRVLDRNYPLSALAKLCYLKDKKSTVYNLMDNKCYHSGQYKHLQESGTLPEGASEDDIIPDNTKIEMLRAHDNNFDQPAFVDTTAAMAAAAACGGYLVSVDTVIPNYGGSLADEQGKSFVKTCILLNKYPDARWGDRKKPGTPSALFNTVYEFRREENGSYDDVIAQVRDFIEKDSALA